MGLFGLFGNKNKDVKVKSNSSFWLDKYYDDDYDDDYSYYDTYADLNKSTSKFGKSDSWIAKWDQARSYKKDVFKLASIRKAISNFVNIVTNRNDIKVTFAGNESSTDKTSVVLSADTDLPLDVQSGLSIHEASHIVLTDFNLKPSIEACREHISNITSVIVADNTNSRHYIPIAYEVMSYYENNPNEILNLKELLRGNHTGIPNKLLIELGKYKSSIESAIYNYSNTQYLNVIDDKWKNPTPEEFTIVKRLFSLNVDDNSLIVTANQLSLSVELYKAFIDLLNWIEDRRIDSFMYETAPGYNGYYEAMYDYYFNSENITKALERGIVDSNTVSSYVFHIGNSLNEKFNPKILPGLEKIINYIDVDNINRLKSTIECAHLTIDVIQMMIEAGVELQSDPLDMNPPPPPQANQNSSEGEGNGDDSDKKKSGDEKSNGSNSGDEKSDGDSGDAGNMKGEGEDEESDSSNSLDSSADASEAKASDKNNGKLKSAAMDDFKKQSDFMNGLFDKKQLTEDEVQDLQATEESNASIVQVGKHMKEAELAPGVHIDTLVLQTLDDKTLNNELLNPCMLSANSSLSNTFKNDVEAGLRDGKILGKKLQIRKEERETVYTKKNKGKIDKRLVASLGYQNDSVFYTREIDSYKKMNIHISLDYSSSMMGDSGDKIRKTIRTACAIAQAAKLAGNIECQISIRSTIEMARSNGQNYLPWVAQIYDSKRDGIQRLKKVFSRVVPSGVTPEGLCFEAIQNKLLPSGNDVDSFFLNMSDGYPQFTTRYKKPSGDYTSFRYNDEPAAKQTYNEVKKMEAKGIKVLSYFISRYSHITEADIFDKSYGKRNTAYIDVNNVTQIAKTMNDLFLKKE